MINILRMQKTKVFDLMKPLWAGYGELFLIDDWRAGVIVCILSLIQPNVGIAGLLSAGITLGFGYMLGLRHRYQWHRQYIRNAVLIGFAVGYVLRLDAMAWPVLALASIATFLLTVFITRSFQSLSLPVMSLPFSIACIFFSLAISRYSELYRFDSIHNANVVLGPEGVPLMVKGFFQCLSYVIFQKNFWVGAVLALAILAFSRMIIIAMFLGFLLGAGLQGFAYGNFEQALMNPVAFNFAYTAACIGVIFLIPSTISFGLSLCAVAISVMLLDAFSNAFTPLHISFYALPFNVTVILLMQSFVYFNFKWRTHFYGSSPEKSFERLDARIQRFGHPDISIALPVEGTWRVLQGFKGHMTHKGLWQYALDLVQCRPDGDAMQQTNSQTGLELQDHFTFGAEVYAPCSGYVVALEKAIPDNPIGTLNESRNWGNFIMLRSDAGAYVSLCHLQQESILATVGQYVQTHQVLARCGNSGYSAEPHLHVQLQWTPYLNAATWPFRISSYLLGSQLLFHDIPQRGEVVASFKRNKALAYAFHWPSGREFVFKKTASEKHEEFERITVQTDEVSGRAYLRDAADTRLFFWTQDAVFYFYDFQGNPDSLLAKLMAALPRLPQSYGEELHFSDFHPPEIAWGPIGAIPIQLARILRFKLKPTGHYQIDASGTRITGLVRYKGKIVPSEVLLDVNYGVRRLKLMNTEFVQVVV